MEYLKRRMRMIAQIRVFTSLDNLHIYLEHNKLDILLLEERLYPLEVQDLDNIHIVIMAEECRVKKEITHPVIRKYQSAKSLIEELTELCPVLREWEESDQYENALDIITVYSLGDGGIGEIFSYLLAEEYVNMNNVLYINMEPFTGLKEDLQTDSRKNMSDLIYYLNEKIYNIKEKLEPMIQSKAKFDVVSGITFSTDLYDLTLEGVRILLNTIREYKRYQLCVINTGFISPAIFEVFRMSSKICIVTGQGKVIERKKGDFLKQLKWAGFEEILDKLKLLSISDEEITIFEKSYEEGLTDERVTEYIKNKVSLNCNTI